MVQVLVKAEKNVEYVEVASGRAILNQGSVFRTIHVITMMR